MVTYAWHTDCNTGFVRTARKATENHPARPCGFTLTEVLVVIGTIGLLASLLLPALARAKSKARTIECLSQKKQLGLAWHLYADDNQGRLVANSGKKMGAGADGPAWIAGIMDWRTFPWVTNIFSYVSDFERTEGQYLLFPYVNNEKMFRCPEDRYLSGPQRATGWAHRGRSISMNMFMGIGADKQRDQLTTVWAPYEISTQLGLTVYARYDQMIKLAPCRAWVITDEHADSIRDATFELGGWASVPGSYHSGAGVFVFADGHTETRRWTDPSFQERVKIRDGLGCNWESPDGRWVMNGMTEIMDGFARPPWFPSQ